jgi:hypothetical protein
MPVGVDYRTEMPTFSDPVELEAARIRSSFRSAPPAAAPARAPAGEPSQAERVSAYERRFGGFDRVAFVVVAAHELASSNLDARASMLLPHLDGRSSIRHLLDIGVMNALDTLAGLAELLERGVVGLRSP